MGQVNSGLVTELPAAVLWDMDGTLVDTEPYWFQAETELVRAAGGTWSAEDGLSLVGAGLWHSARVFQGRGVDLPEDEIVKRLTDRVLEQVEVAVPWRAGVLDLLADLHRTGMRMAVVTMSVRRMAEHVAAALPFPAFDIIVPGDDLSDAEAIVQRLSDSRDG